MRSQLIFMNLCGQFTHVKKKKTVTTVTRTFDCMDIHVQASRELYSFSHLQNHNIDYVRVTVDNHSTKIARFYEVDRVIRR